MVADWQRRYLPEFRRSGAEWRGPCPVHQGKRDSFALNAETGQAFCHSDCSRGWSLLQLHAEINGVTAQEARVAVAGEPVKPREVARYDYSDETGQLLYQVIRMEPKNFLYRRPGKGSGLGQWIWNLNGVRRVLFRLPRVLKAETVFVVEGEKDVLSLERLAITATTNTGGAGKWNDSYTEALAGKRIVILPDNDDKGRKHAAMVQAALAGKATSCAVVHLPGLKEAGDVSDWLVAGGSLDQLWRLVDAAKTDIEAVNWDWRGLGRKFVVEPRGIFLSEVVKGKQEHIWLCALIEVLAVTRNHDGAAFGLLVSFRSREGKMNKVIIQNRSLMGDGSEALAALSDRGFRMQLGRTHLAAIKDFLNQSETEKKILTTDRVGWSGRSFVFPDLTISAPGEDEVIFDAGSIVDHKYVTAGTLDDWRLAIAGRCVGNNLLIFSVAAAFAAALIPWADVQGSGFHYVALSSKGKTTAVRLAGSVWGGTRENGFLDTWRATSNGLEAKGMLHNHSLLCLDEISEVGEKEISGIIYMLGNGVGKQRMTKNYTSRRAAVFSLLYLSSGEKTLADLMESTGKDSAGGQESRMVQIDANMHPVLGSFECLHGAADGETFSKQLTAASKKFYGCAIREFLTGITGRWDECREVFQRVMADFKSDHLGVLSKDAATELFRVGTSFALVAAGGELATRLGVTGWQPGTARNAASLLWSRWIDSRGGEGARDVTRGLALLRSFLMRFGESRFQDLDDLKNQRFITDRAGFRESVGDGRTRFLIPGETMAQILKGLDVRSVMRAARAAGMLETAPNSERHQVSKRIPGLDKIWFYSIVFSDSEGLEKDGAEAQFALFSREV